MSKRVLFVDDEQSLLNGIERRLAGSFNLVTAFRPEDAAEAAIFDCARGVERRRAAGAAGATGLSDSSIGIAR